MPTLQSFKRPNWRVEPKIYFKRIPPPWGYDFTHRQLRLQAVNFFYPISRMVTESSRAVDAVVVWFREVEDLK